MKRPAGVKGPFKVVDPRLKKDMRAKKLMDKKKNKKAGRGRR
jgi:AdoMet-dependent rRNA methyltransferase SPB1